MVCKRHFTNKSCPRIRIPIRSNQETAPVAVYAKHHVTASKNENHDKILDDAVLGSAALYHQYLPALHHGHSLYRCPQHRSAVNDCAWTISKNAYKQTMTNTTDYAPNNLICPSCADYANDSCIIAECPYAHKREPHRNDDLVPRPDCQL